MTDLREEPWFFQELPPDLAIAILQSLVTGTFLVRSFKKRLSLSLVVDDNVRHYWIHQHDDGGCYIDDRSRFSTIEEMVMFYSDNPGLGSQLGRYPDKENLDKLWTLNSAQLILTNFIAETSLPFIVKSGHYGDKPIIAFVSKLKQSTTDNEILRNQGRLWMTLDHENITKFIGMLLTDTTFTLLSEECPSGRLLDFLTARKESLLSEWVYLVMAGHQIASGTNYLHRKGIVHNEMILENWGVLHDPFIVRLTSLHHATFEDSYLKPFQQSFYTRHCRLPLKPPELICLIQQQSSDFLTTCQSDLWALGLLYWRLFHLGESPSLPIRIDNLVTAPWPQLPQDLCSVLNRIIQSCLHEVPQLRMTTSEIIKEFRVLLELRKSRRRSVSRKPPSCHTAGESSYEAGFSSANSNATTSLDTAPITGKKMKKKRRFLQQLRATRIPPPSPRSISSVESSYTHPKKVTPTVHSGAGHSFLKGLRTKINGLGHNSASSAQNNKTEKAERQHQQAGCNDTRTKDCDLTDLIASDVSLEDLTSAGENRLTLSYEQLLGVAKALKATLKREKLDKIQLEETLRQRECSFGQKLNSLSQYYQTKLDDVEFRLQECESDKKNTSRSMVLQEKAYEERLMNLKRKIVRLENEKTTLELQLKSEINGIGETVRNNTTNTVNFAGPSSAREKNLSPMNSELVDTQRGFNILRFPPTDQSSSPFLQHSLRRYSGRRRLPLSESPALSCRGLGQRKEKPPTPPPHKQSTRGSKKNTRSPDLQLPSESPMIPKRSSSMTGDSDNDDSVSVLRGPPSNHDSDAQEYSSGLSGFGRSDSLRKSVKRSSNRSSRKDSTIRIFV